MFKLFDFLQNHDMTLLTHYYSILNGTWHYKLYLFWTEWKNHLDWRRFLISSDDRHLLMIQHGWHHHSDRNDRNQRRREEAKKDVLLRIRCLSGKLLRLERYRWLSVVGSKNIQRKFDVKCKLYNVSYP